MGVCEIGSASAWGHVASVIRYGDHRNNSAMSRNGRSLAQELSKCTIARVACQAKTDPNNPIFSIERNDGQYYEN